MIPSPFNVHGHHLKKNHDQGEDMRNLPALEPDGAPAVAVIVHGRPALVLSQKHALRLSSGVIDALEAAAINE